MKKRILSIIMAFCLIASLLPTVALAADNATISATKNEVKAGETFDVSLVIPNITDKLAYSASFAYSFDNSVFEVVNFSAPAIGDVSADAENSADGNILCTYTGVKGGNTLDFSSGLTITATFKVKDDATPGSYSFVVDEENTFAYFYNEETYEDEELFTVPSGLKTSVTVIDEDSGDSAERYTAGLSTTAANNEVDSEGELTVNVAVGHSSDAVFNAGEIKLSYDGTLLTPDTASLGELKYKIDGDETTNAVLTVEDFGADKNLNYNYAITFNAAKVDADTKTTVTLTSAAFVHKNNASTSDLIKATIDPEELEVTIKVPMVNVTLRDQEAGTEKTETIEKGKDYTFAPNDTNHYEYTEVSATVNDQKVTVTDNGDGTFTIAGDDVTGDIVLTYTKTAKSYNVTVNGEGDAAEEKVTLPQDAPTYGVNYVFTMPADKAAGQNAGYTYALASVTINGAAYTGYQVSGKTYTILGTAITGDIVINITKTEVQANTFTVSVDGTGAGDATVNNVNNLVTSGGVASITLNPKEGYTYTVTATMVGGEPVVTENNNTYEVNNVSGNVVFTVTKTLVVDSVAVHEYVKVDEFIIYLVTFTTEIEDEVPTYDGNVMFWSDKYEAYCWLVIDTTLNAETAKTKIGAQSPNANVENVNYSMNINNASNVIDAADAQMVWNMYNAVYNNFDTVKMEQFLAADQNATSDNPDSWKLNVEDAQVIINAILNGNAQ